MLAIFLIVVFHFLNPYCCSRFNAKEWKTAGMGSDWEITEKEIACLRGGMLFDLRMNHIKTGMHKEELFSLLGPPIQSLGDKAKGCFNYSIGYCRGLGFDLNSITFCFDANGRLLNTDGDVRG
jgi:hypothetical protein